MTMAMAKAKVTARAAGTTIEFRWGLNWPRI
jgi:hypothetical protein